MKLALVSRPLKESEMRLAKQLGVTDIVSVLPGHSPLPNREQESVWEYLPLVRLRKQVEDAGLTLSVIESIPISDRITLGLPGRDEDLNKFCESVANMGRAGIPILCYNFMAVFNWLRTSTTTRGRGGALVTSYDHSLMENAPLIYTGEVSDEKMWENFEYFLKKVMPVAEEFKVKLALHPDDPPLSPIRGLARIIRNVDAFKRVIEMVPSDNNGITFCQGNFAAMGNVDVPQTIRYFGQRNKIFFAHFRDVRGSVPKFEETFHDEGKTNMAETMRAYRDIGFDGPMRPDHAPTMEGESNDEPGYMIYGKLFAVGYMKGLIDAVNSEK
jgi:mannonate dehydratase